MRSLRPAVASVREVVQQPVPEAVPQCPGSWTDGAYVPAYGDTLNLTTQSARHDDSVAVVHAVQPQQVAVLAGPLA